MSFAVVSSVLAFASVAHADPFADALKESTGEYSASFVLTKLTTFKLGKKCLARLPDKNEGAIHAASFYTRDIEAYAKAVTGDDWAAIEGGGDREATRATVEQKIEAFKSRLAVNVSVEGDDCDAKQNSLWLRYWGQIGTSLRNFPPKATKVTVNLNVTTKVKEVTVDVSKDASTFTITAPRDLESTGYADRIDRPFRKLQSELTDDLAFEVKEATGTFTSAWVMTKLTTLKVGKKCFAKLANKDNGVIHAATFYVRDIMEYAKLVGADDWDKIEHQSANDPKTNRELAAKMMDEFKSRFSVTVTVEGDDCDAGQNAHWIGFWTQIATTLKNYPPKANKVVIKLDVTSKAKDLSVGVGKDGSTFTITAPRDKELPAWTGKFDEAFKKVMRKPK